MSGANRPAPNQPAPSPHRPRPIRIGADPGGPVAGAWWVGGGVLHMATMGERPQAGPPFRKPALGMTVVCSLLAAVFAPGASAHPASGIVVNAKGEVYFIHTGRGVG